MPPKTPVMISGLNTLRRDNNISIVNNDVMQDLQVVMMRELRGVID